MVKTETLEAIAQFFQITQLLIMVYVSYQLLRKKSIKKLWTILWEKFHKNSGADGTNTLLWDADSGLPDFRTFFVSQDNYIF